MEADELYYEKYFEKLSDTVEQGLISESKIGWYPIKIDRIRKIWSDYIKYGIVRDEKGIDDIVECFIDKIIQIDINTMLYGHTQHNPIEFIKDFIEKEISEEELEKIQIYVEANEGNWIISDYGLPKLKKILRQLICEIDYVQKLLLIDQILNVVHQRSDLAAWFIEGGREALENLSNS